MLEVKNLRYKYPDNHEALKGITFKISEGEKVALVGANGSGKSTLLLHVAGALRVQEGEIIFKGEINNPEALRKNIGLTFQDADDQILMPTVLEDAAFSLVASGMRVKEAHERAEKILAELGISHLALRPPHKLSGGEKRLVSFAGILAAEPELIVLDEPSAGLDPKARRLVINFLQESDKTILLASHDLDLVIDTCTRAIILNDGKISLEGELPKLFTNKRLLEANGLELPLRFS